MGTRHASTGSAQEDERQRGEMGKRDMMIVAAIYRSIAENGKRQQLNFEPNYGFEEY